MLLKVNAPLEACTEIDKSKSMRGLMLNTHYQPLVPEMTPESLQYISIAQMETDRRIVPLKDHYATQQPRFFQQANFTRGS